MATPLRRNILALGLCGLLVVPSGRGQSRPGGDLSFLQPWFEAQPSERGLLARRGVVVRILPAVGSQLGVVAACAVSISPDAFVARVRRAGDVERPELAAGRFSEPPALGDLASLTLDQGDVERLRRCRPGDCRLKLSDEEMLSVQRGFEAPADASASEGQRAFQRVVLDRVERYRSGGLDALPAYHDSGEPVHPAAVFKALLERTPLKTSAPDVDDYLSRFPFSTTARPESFLLWSKAMINKKAVVMVVHVGIFRRRAAPHVPDVLVVGKQVFASRYMNGELTLTMLYGGEEGAPRYLVHVERSDLDAIDGVFGGLKRALIERRVKEEARLGLSALRDRLESANSRLR